MYVREFTIWYQGVEYVACIDSEKLNNDTENINVNDLAFQKQTCDSVPCYTPFLEHLELEPILRSGNFMTFMKQNEDLLGRSFDCIRLQILRDDTNKISIGYFVSKQCEEISKFVQNLPDNIVDIAYFTEQNHMFVLLDNEGNLWTILSANNKIDKPAVLTRIPCARKIVRINRNNSKNSVIVYDESDIAIQIKPDVNVKFEILNTDPILDVHGTITLFTSGDLRGDGITAHGIRCFKLVEHLVSLNEDSYDGDFREFEFQFLYAIDYTGNLWVTDYRSGERDFRFLGSGFDSFERPKQMMTKSARSH